MSKHTGTWQAIKYTRSHAYRVTTTPDNARGDICNVLAGLGAQTDAQVAANARLIAAAPELLEALKEARGGLSGGLWDFAPGQNEHIKCEELIKNLDAIIAKAEGTL